MRAVIVGGSNGLGLAIAKELIESKYKVDIIDKVEPYKGVLDQNCYKFHYCDLRFLNEDFICSLAEDRSVSMLVITAGVGRISEFEYFDTSEIKSMFDINTISVIRILRIFYDRIKENDNFNTVVISSIAGLLSSPLAAVYSATKAAICRFIESVNIELEASGTKNRILDVSPSSFKGSRFYGEKNQIELLENLSKEIVKRATNNELIYIPQFDETFKSILERYHSNPHEYGLHSYLYKKESGRIDNSKHMIVGYLSGTFDLFHIGHLNLLRKAKQDCDYLIVGVHESGSWKGKETFIPFEERKQIVESCKYVDKVITSCREDSDAWDLWHYDKLFVGSDYKGSERFLRYEKQLKDKGVKIVYFEYTKSTSSTQIRNALKVE